MKSFMILIVTALAMGETLATTSDLLKGNQMVSKVFEVFNQRIQIVSDVGEDIIRVDGTIELKGLNSSYPSRPDILIFKDFDLKVQAGKSKVLVGGVRLLRTRKSGYEKMKQGLMLGIALVVHGGMKTIALAYSGTGNNKAIEKLLYFDVSDVNNEVRRAVVLAIGFVMYSEPEQTPQIVSILCESYNRHVRYGAAMVVGISCAGTDLSETISLLEPMTSDVDGLVRQGALITMAMVMIQISEAIDSHVEAFRWKLEKII